MKLTFQERKRIKREAYETACRTPGTPEYAARQARLNERTNRLLREQEQWHAERRAERAAEDLARTKAHLAPLIAATRRSA